MSTLRKTTAPSTPTRIKATPTRGGASRTPDQTPRARTTSTRGTASTSVASPRTRTTSTQGTTSLGPRKVTADSAATRSKSPGRVRAGQPSPSPSPFVEPKTPLSIREAIALKRAEVKKTLPGLKAQSDESPVDSIPGYMQTDGAELSRWSIIDSIEHARTSGSLNLSSRSLASLPTALFEIHLGVTPEPLKLAPKETEEELRAGKAKKHVQTSWFEAVDLTALKLRDNAILELQPEISLFGSLKILDLRNNRLTTLPHTLGDLVNLVTLDLSSNQLTCLPEDIGTLPLLTTLDISSNQLTTLPLRVSSYPTSSANTTSSLFAPPTIERASRPLPSLRHLLAADNKLVTASIPVDDLPPHLSRCDLGNNPLGTAKALVHALSQLSQLKELLMAGTDVADDSFASVKGFAALNVLDLGKTKVTERIGEVFENRSISWDGEEIEDGVRIILGTRVKKEPWEIDIEKGRMKKTQLVQNAQQTELLKENWELDAERGLLTEGGRRRARVPAAAAETRHVSSSPEAPFPSGSSSSTSATVIAPTLTQYYDSVTSTLTLPRSLPRAHARTRSLAPMVSDGSDPTVPAPTLPLPTIISQPFAGNLRVLVLASRRLDPSFALPTNYLDSEPLLPALEELRLDCCALGESVSISYDGPESPPKSPIFSILATLFPSLTSLDLSDNKLTCLSGVRALLIPDPARKNKGLKVLRLRGNKISDLMGLEAVAQVLKSEGRVEGWRMEELDLRDNEIAKLPPILGYLPLDVLLVEGNTFRVPARRVWEREGTKGLLSWLKDRVES